MLKNTVKDKKELKEKRNIQTAKLSRDRKKLEVEFMRENALNYIKCLNRIRNYLNNVVQQNGKESGFASKIIKRIKKFSDDLPQNFEFIEDKSTNLDEMSDHFSSLDLTSDAQSTISYGPRKKGRPRKSESIMHDRRDNKRVRKETNINFDEYVSKPNLVSRLTQANDQNHKKILLERKKQMERG